MATTKPRFSITVSDEIYEEINTYQHEHRLATQTKAIAELIERGIDALRSPSADSAPAPAAAGISEEEWAMIEAYRIADAKDRAVVDLILADYKESARSKKHAG